ncbi:MAG: flagellar hook-basal body protein [Gaiellales bacterium]
MERGLFAAASGMLADQIRQDVIANNLANATTAGFKGDVAVGEAFPDMLVNQLQSGASVGKLGLGSRITETATDASQGSIVRTGNTYDLAIAGPGWFSVQGPSGKAYTQNGAFTVDAKGQLVTADALPVLDSNGRPVNVGGDNAVVTPDGNVTVGGRQVAKLAITALDPKRLHKLGDNLYTGTVDKTTATGRVEQGYLENSNVNSVKEMVDLISTMRSFEAGQKAVSAIDDSLGKAVNDVARIT